LEEGEEKEEGEIVVSSAAPPVSFPSRSRIPSIIPSSTTSYPKPTPPPPPPPVHSFNLAESPVSTTPPPRKREPILDTRGETPPLPSPHPGAQAVSHSITTASISTPIETSITAEDELDKEEGEICSEADLVRPEIDVEGKSERPQEEIQVPVAESREDEVVEAVLKETEVEVDHRVSEREIEEQKEIQEDEEDVDMFETTIVGGEEESLPISEVVSVGVLPEAERNEAEEKEDTNKMQVDEEAVPEQQFPIEPIPDRPKITAQEEEPIAHDQMEVERLESMPSSQATQPDASSSRIASPPLVEAVLPPPPPIPQDRQESSSIQAEEVAEPVHPSSTTPLDHHSPPQPISPPTKHVPSGQDELLLSSTASEEEKLGSAEVQDKAASRSVPLADREEWFKPTWEDFPNHDLMIPFLFEEFEERDQRRGEKMVELRKEYRVYDKDWQAHVKRLDKEKEQIQPKTTNSTAPQTPSIDSAGMPYYPEPVTPGPLALGGGRANRRGGGGGGLSNSSWGYGDAVRSEAEFLEILASLENADLRDPDVRAARTAAVVPDMAVDPSERAEIISCNFDDDRYRIEDPVEAYGIVTPMETWTEAEVETYCKGYSQHPKQFGKIAQNLPDKTTAQCVLFYYRMKNAIDFRSLSERRGRDGRRKKTKKRAGKGSSLLSNLKGARSTMLGNRDDDDDDEDDERPVPPSPRNTRAPPLPSNDSSALPGSATPRPLPGALERLFDDDNDEYTPSAPSKNARNPRNGTSLPQLHSEGMMEAAEVLGALAAIPNDDQDDSGASSLRPRAAKTNRKVRMELDDDGAIETTVQNDKLKPKRKANSSSYWSAAEKTDILRLLEQHGKNWKAIGEEMGTKTAVQCRNVSNSSLALSLIFER
jgi:hypothetical protein